MSVGGLACQRKVEDLGRVVPQVSAVTPRRVEFSASGDRLLIQEASGLVGLWNVTQPTRPELLASMRAFATDARFTPDGAGIITGGWDGRIRRWSTTGQPIWVSQDAHRGRARCVTVTADAVVSGGAEGAIRFWNLNDGSVQDRSIPAHEAAVMSVDVSPATGDVVSMGGDEAIRLWKRIPSRGPGNPPSYQANVLYQDPQRQFRQVISAMLSHDPLYGWERAVAFSPRGDVIVGSVLDGVVRFWNADGSVRGTPLGAHNGKRVRSFSFSGRGDLLVSGGWDGSLRFWGLDGVPRGEPVAAHTLVFSVAANPQGDIVASTGMDERLRLWSADGVRVAEFPAPRPERVVGVVPLAQQPAFVVGCNTGNRGAVRVWGFDGASRSTPMLPEGGRVVAMAVSPRGNALAASGRDGSFRVWTIDGKPHGEPFKQHRLEVSALAFSPKGNVIASGARHEPMRLWSLNGISRPLMTGVGDTMDFIQYSPQGDVILAAGTPGKIQLWQGDGQPLTAPFKAHVEFIRAIAFAPDGQSFASMGGDTLAIKLWNLDGTPRRPPLEGHTGIVRGLAFTPSGQQLVSGGDDGVIRIWTLLDGAVETLEVGVPINQLGFWRDVLWVRAAGDSILFFDHARQLRATMILRCDAVLGFTPDGWVAGPQSAGRFIHAYRASGERLAERDAAERLAPERVLAAIAGRKG
jgi:WD40 repeat protein